ncbi:uncharacterized protein LAESUDRAFT_194264 [Laetiporus sulphureus 93-53]|uniref:Uncharacterized protein n=1 Tax=Laetiporus sulphureus 93-53 TaxID=1314785 RepID=A0A165E0U6_9APHY|nr:uncharacterized protein LAESUDRAFT_194264 [Laetiporus sulphureus 93-53]KZT06028.1 hypothetical protein LAESUDRAFT_194264 [Laetiporus sulphureus 93-53]
MSNRGTVPAGEIQFIGVISSSLISPAQGIPHFLRSHRLGAELKCSPRATNFDDTWIETREEEDKSARLKGVGND